MKRKLNGLLRYIASEMKLADSNNVTGYINREIYKRYLFDERFELQSDTTNTNLLNDVAVKKNCPSIHTTWYAQKIKEYRTFNMSSQYGISLIEYLSIPCYIHDILLNDAIEVKNRDATESNDILNKMSKNNSYFDKKDFEKLR